MLADVRVQAGAAYLHATAWCYWLLFYQPVFLRSGNVARRPVQRLIREQVADQEREAERQHALSRAGFPRHGRQHRRG